MRVLLLLRGSAGVGKSTWIEKNGLKQYTLSADDIRMLCASPELTLDGSVGISQKNDGVVWKTLFTLLETRMQKGEFTVIDATNSKTSEMNRYKKLCDTYRYRIYCVDFTDVPIEEVKRRNANREPLKRVPESVIDNMYARFATQKIPSGIKVIKPDELDTVFMKPVDLSGYKKIHHIGDVHGCYTALQSYLSSNGGMKDDEFYIFTGDYIDRGIENAEVVKFLISIKDQPNVLLLEGNHERWLYCYSHEIPARSKDFETGTKVQLDSAQDLKKKDIRQLYRKLAQCAYYKYGDKMFFVTHAGLSTLPENLSFVSTYQMIHGVGSYNDFEKVADSFVKTTPNNVYQIHGHRNTKGLPVQVNERSFNLEGRVEFGGCLRCVQVTKDGFQTFEVQNTVFKEPEPLPEDVINNGSMDEIVAALRNNKHISEKAFGNISSFNFTRDAFYDRVWNAQTIKARGLYIDTVKNKVIARSYNKFFNVNELEETRLESLKDKLVFPVTAYVKENGFLGIVGYNEYTDDLFIASKSSPESDNAKWLKDMLYKEVADVSALKNYIKEHNVSFVFECVDVEHDPHVIDYPESKLFLLDIVYNNIEFAKYDYNTMVDIANRFGLTPKEMAYEIATWQEFYDWYYDVLEEDYEYGDRGVIEGFVVEDANGYMIKVKLAYYNFWKFMRRVAQESIKNGYINNTSALSTPLANEFYAWVRKLHDAEDKNSIPQNICALRKMFYEDQKKL